MIDLEKSVFLWSMIFRYRWRSGGGPHTCETQGRYLRIELEFIDRPVSVGESVEVAEGCIYSCQ